MRAGLMRDVLVFESPVEETTPSGFVRKEYKEVFRCRAYRKKQSIVSGDERAKEEFLGQMAVFQVRAYPKIDYQCRVRWANCVWEIKMIEQRPGELTLTLKKIDV